MLRALRCSLLLTVPLFLQLPLFTSRVAVARCLLVNARLSSASIRRPSGFSRPRLTLLPAPSSASQMSRARTAARSGGRGARWMPGSMRKQEDTWHAGRTERPQQIPR